MRRRIVTKSVVVLLGALVCSARTFAEPLPADMLQRVATEADIKTARFSDATHISGVVIRISEIYRVPISFEWSFVNDDRSAAEYPDISFAVNAGDTLTITLERFCGASKGLLQWASIRGIICIWPAVQGQQENLLNTPVTLKLDNVSTWHAYLELAKAVNTKASDRFLKPSVAYSDGRLPPPALREDKKISCNLENVTAREAACAIIAMSQMRLAFKYTNFYRPVTEKSRPSADIFLWPYTSEHKIARGPRMETGEDLAVWITEADSVVPKQEEIIVVEPE